MQAFELITTKEGLEHFAQINTNIEWMCFDSEFVGEKRFTTRLCLIQVATEHGLFLIDPFPLKSLGPFLKMIEDPNIVKITHAGENDYRLLYATHGTIPKNTFDTQIAAGFLGYRYPLAFKKLVETELKINLNKSFTVADWEARPFNQNQLKYAIQDIEPLYDLWKKQEAELKRHQRLHWAEEEFRGLEREAYYARDPHHEALNSDLMKSLNKRERLFLLRLFEWRRKTAEEKNYSKEMVLPSKFMSQIVRSMRSGRAGLRENRRIPDKFAGDLWPVMNELYLREISEDEKFLLRQVPTEDEENPNEEILTEFLYLIIRHQCMQKGISHALALPRNWFKKIKNDPGFAEEVFTQGWRKELFGDTFIRWLSQPDNLRIEIKPDVIELRLSDN
ncbi:MAG: ribonuclease D [Haliscomenobacter sp.]|uniref:ribonuclease D n=1 Tax=Haliscomenobacter sp. TaxID=2717303 RepID=UPI0029B84999|nr:ribonuclease D [Haliscomenobacter sp.]MDX2070741.1 ribonuclease D [Haliscomenobacter sp.]